MSTVYSDSYGSAYASLRRDFLGGRLSCILSVNDIFRTSEGWQRSVLPGRNYNLYDADSRSFGLQITYKFGKSKHQYQSMSGSAEEQGRL